jgi:hypothetical protein
MHRVEVERTRMGFSFETGPARSTRVSPKPSCPGSRSTSTGASATAVAATSIILLTASAAWVGLSIEIQADRPSTIRVSVAA